MLSLAAAVVMAACAALHLLAAADADMGGVQSLLLLGMALACMPCATQVLLAPTRAAWIRSGLLSTVMLGAHWLLNLLQDGHAGHGEDGVSSATPLIHVGMVAGPALALGLAVVGVRLLRRA